MNTTKLVFLLSIILLVSANNWYNCPEGYVGKTIENPDDCDPCDKLLEGCTRCKKSYPDYEFSCIECAPHYYYHKETSHCEKCPTHCLVCEVQYENDIRHVGCKYCQPGFVLDSHNVQCIVETVTNFSKQVIRILGQNPGPMTLQGTNTYLIGEKYNRILIDCGQGIPEYKDILSKVLEDTKSNIHTLLITHHHFDHTKGIKQILELNKNVIIKKFGYLQVDKELENNFNFKYQFLQDNELLEGEGFTLQVIRLSGHSEDHVCFMHKEENILFTGDFILGGSSSIVGNDMIFQMQSYKTALDLNVSNIFPGHGHPTFGAKESKVEIIKNQENRIQREQQVLNCFNQQNLILSADDILKIVYKDLNNSLFMIAKSILYNIFLVLQIQKVNICSHLNKLIKENIIVEIEQNKFQLKSSAADQERNISQNL